jgi:hypothetical protein
VNLLRVGGLAVGQHVLLPLVAVDLGRHRGGAQPHERAPADLSADVAVLGQPFVHARCREVVDARGRGELARGRELGAWLEPPVLDGGDEGLGELGGDRRLRVSVDLPY